MGMYTEVNIGVKLRKDTPKMTLDILSYMVDNKRPFSNCEHPLFLTPRWENMLHGDSYYFDTIPSVRWEYDKIAEAWFLSAVSNIKNYDNEWEKFLDFLGPYIETEGYLGTYRYEEYEDPTLLYRVKNKVVFKKAEIAR